MDIKIIVATHKPYKMPDDPMYLPVHAGHKGKPDIGYRGDDTGDNISERNPYYCELSAIYWAWKNLDADAIGVAHYRRHFTTKGVLGYKCAGKWNSILTKAQAEHLLGDFDVLLPNKRHYYIETNYNHYVHAHNREGLDLVIKVLSEKYPDYVKAADTVMQQTWAHMFNMFVMKRKWFHQYCDWLFDVLFTVEEQLDISSYTVSEARVFGYLSELMLDIWLETNRPSCKEIHAMFMEKQNWIIKTKNFFKRKFKRGESN